jgi:hypothetical protein
MCFPCYRQKTVTPGIHISNVHGAARDLPRMNVQSELLTENIGADLRLLASIRGFFNLKHAFHSMTACLLFARSGAASRTLHFYLS